MGVIRLGGPHEQANELTRFEHASEACLSKALLRPVSGSMVSLGAACYDVNALHVLGHAPQILTKRLSGGVERFNPVSQIEEYAHVTHQITR